MQVATTAPSRTDSVRRRPTEDTDVSLRGNDETFHGLPAGKLNRNQSYSRETRGDRSDCSSLRKTRTTNSRETNASRVSNSQVESHYVAPPPPPPPLNPA